MTTQMIFRIDKKLKLAAQRRAKSQGITLSHLYKQATRSFVAGKLDITITALLPEIPNTRTARLFKVALRDIKLGRNFSPSFDNAEEAVSYLKKYAS
ncbi:MAG: hypothetical protein AAB453_01980 [Patescibacteria group bacterium]